MLVRRIATGLLLGITMAALCTPVALADTCCANTPVQLQPTRAVPGDTVRLTGIECLNADNSGPLPLNLKRFWLSPSTVAADVAPDVAPGPGMPADIPPTDQWPLFKSVPGPTGSGPATIVVPDLPRGSYQLWWLCDNGGGPGSGIHYSSGPRLVVGSALPSTATVDPRPRRVPAALLLLTALGAGLLLLRASPKPRRRSDG